APRMANRRDGVILGSCSSASIQPVQEFAIMPRVADRNLLFGILALQMDFITRDQLIVAMHAWVLDKAKPLGQILQERGALPAERHALLEALVQEHLKLHDHDARKSLAALSSLGSAWRDLEQIPDAEVQASLASVAVAWQAEDTY